MVQVSQRRRRKRGSGSGCINRSVQRWRMQSFARIDPNVPPRRSACRIAGACAAGGACRTGCVQRPCCAPVPGVRSAIRRRISGTQEPQLVPAPSASPSASGVIRPWSRIAVVRVLMPTLKQEQTIAPASCSPGGGVPRSRRPRSASCSSGFANNATSHSRAGSTYSGVTIITASRRPATIRAAR